MGKDKFTTQYGGADWHFSSPENLALFTANPEKYAPQYGGYCALAVSENSLAPSDPTQWTIYNEKLYLNYNADVQKKWLKNKTERIVTADKNWLKGLD